MNIIDQVKLYGEEMRWTDADMFQWDGVIKKLGDVIKEVGVGDPELNGCEDGNYIAFSWDSLDWHVALYINSAGVIEGHAHCRDDFYMPDKIETHIAARQINSFLDYYLSESKVAA